MARHRYGHVRRWAASALAAAVIGVAPLAVAHAQETPPPNDVSDRAVAPEVLDTGNASPRNECRTLTGLAGVSAFQIPGEGRGFPDGSPYSDGTLEISIAGWDAESKSFDWSSSLAVLGVWVKGGSGGEGNWYDHASFADLPPAAGADHDGGLHAKPNPNGPAGLSHATFCYLLGAPATPDLTIDKASDAEGVLRVGDRFSYRIVVANVGGATARDVEVTDELPAGVRVLTLVPDFDGGPCTVASSVGPGGGFAMSVTCRRPTLAASASASITFQVAVTEDARCGAMRNVATVSGDDEPRAHVDGGNTAVSVDEIACRPSIALDASGPALAHQGDEVTYRFLVTNDGEADLREVALRDARCDAPAVRTDHGNGDGVLAPREAWSYRCTRVIEAGDGDPAPNTAEVTATDGDTEVADSASHPIDVIHPAIEIQKTVDPVSGQVGDTVSYAFEVTNTGDTPLFDIVVADDVIGAIGRIAQLSPGRSATLTADHVLPSTDVRVVNVGTASGVDGLGLGVSDSDSAFITIVAADDADDGVGGSGGGTAFTGGDAGGPATLAGLLLLIGLAALAVARWRPPASS